MLWLWRMRLWARRPPTRRQAALFFGVVAVCIALAAVEWAVGWPDWLTVDRAGIGIPRR